MHYEYNWSIVLHLWKSYLRRKEDNHLISPQMCRGHRSQKQTLSSDHGSGDPHQSMQHQTRSKESSQGWRQPITAKIQWRESRSGRRMKSSVWVLVCAKKKREDDAQSLGGFDSMLWRMRDADVVDQTWTYSRTSTEFMSWDAGEGHGQGGDADDWFHCL